MPVPFGSARLERLVKRLGRLPGIGSKSAARLALHLLYADDTESDELITALREMKAHVRPCTRCGAIAEGDLCDICQDARRDDGQLCVVANATDVFTMERAAIFRGRYHVLGGLLSPLDGIGPADLNLYALFDRVEGDGFEEIVLALAGSVEGEATALYIGQQLSDDPVRITRLATGIPVGGHLEFVDDVTLTRAFSARLPLS
ncbi:recombination protein RecR [bacterium]|nr:MAG: recombination protein RecR [bacterium]